MQKAVVIYHYFEANEQYKRNLQFFLERAYDSEIDYIFAIAGGCSFPLPSLPNIRYIFIPNSHYDFGGFSHVVNEVLELENYYYFIFVNCSVRGPFLPEYYKDSWTRPYLDMLVGDVKLVGSTINIMNPNHDWSRRFRDRYGFREPYSHVQSMVYAMDKLALEFLIQKNFYKRDLAADKISIVLDYEILMSQLVINNNWNIACLLPEYKNIDYRRPHSDVNPTSVDGDPSCGGAYFHRSAHPLETMFVKTNRNVVDLSLLSRLEESQVAGIGDEQSAYSSSKFDDDLDRIASAWKANKNFAIWLTKRLKPRTIVDLGVDYGYSTFCLAASGFGHVYGIDSFEGDEHAGLRDTQIFVTDALSRLALSNVTLIKGFFEDVARTWSKPLDILHIDGLHTYEAVRRDFDNWARFVNAKGVILLHNTCVEHFGVRRLFDEIKQPKTNLRNGYGLGIISWDRGIVQEIASNFEVLVEPGSSS